ncbi:MAG: hypothetical protein HY898_17095 [Deltaproteobacteria bacterium]|nr:hypothetical protein [Deltaproteobacteria bacterium]
MRRVARGCVGALLALVVLGAGSLHAEPSAADKETARQLMAQGRAARSAGDLKTALARFQAADDLMHVPTTGVELAKAQIALGLLVEARDNLLKVIRHPIEKKEPAPFARARAEAAELDTGLKARIPSVVIRVTVTPPDAPFEVTIDGDEVPGSALGSTRSVNPGPHVVLARSGDSVVRAELNLAEGQTRDVPLELHAAAPPAPSASAAPSAAPSAAASHAPAPPASSAHNVLRPAPTAPARPGAGPALVIAGIATTGVGVLLGSIAGGIALSKRNSAVKRCVDIRCPPDTHDDIDAANTFATMSNIGFVIGGVGAGVAIAGLILGSPAPRAPTQGAWVHPFVGWSSAGVSGGF